MKKLLFALATVILLLSTIPCVAEKAEGSGMVYASGIELENAYEALKQEGASSSNSVAKILKYDGLSIVKESITPVYTINLLEYSKTSELSIVPWYAGKNMDCRVYSSKMVDENGEYSGFMRFYIENGIAYRIHSSPQPFKDYEYQSASTSYADHAKRIQKILKLDNLVSPVDVKYVMIDGVGDFFCVKNQEQTHFVSVGMIPNSSLEQSENFQTDYVLDCAQLKQIADQQLERHNALLAEMEQWKKEHPGEEWNATGSDNGQPVVNQCSEVDNILNIAEYLNIDFTVNWDSGKTTTVAVDFFENSAKNNFTPTNVLTKAILIGGACLLVGALTFAGVFCFRRKVKNSSLS